MAGDVVRAGRGAAWAAPVPTLAVTLPTEGTPDRDALRTSLSPWLPVIELDGGELLVLCPQMSERQIELVVQRVVTGCGGAAIERSAITVAQLCDMAPLPLSWDNESSNHSSNDPASPTVVAGKGTGS